MENEYEYLLEKLQHGSKLTPAERARAAVLFHWNDEKVIAPYGRCRVCSKVCPFNHAVPDDELVCDVCAGIVRSTEIDW